MDSHELHHLLIEDLDLGGGTPQVHLCLRPLDLNRTAPRYDPAFLVLDSPEVVKLLHHHFVVVEEDTPSRVEEYPPVGDDRMVSLLAVMDPVGAVEPHLFARHQIVFERHGLQFGDERKLQNRMLSTITEDPKSPAIIPSAVSELRPMFSMNWSIG